MGPPDRTFPRLVATRSAKLLSYLSVGVGVGTGRGVCAQMEDIGLMIFDECHHVRLPALQAVLPLRFRRGVAVERRFGGVRSTRAGVF